MGTIDLSEFFITKRQATDFETALSNIESGLYETDFDLEKVLKSNLGVNKKDKFLTLLRENEVPLDSNTKIKEFFVSIRKVIASMGEVTLILAVEPNDEILRSVGEWLVLNLKKQILINTEVKNSVVGGAEIYFQGKHFDASVQKVFEEICSKLLNNNANIVDKKEVVSIDEK